MCGQDVALIHLGFSDLIATQRSANVLPPSCIFGVASLLPSGWEPAVKRSAGMWVVRGNRRNCILSFYSCGYTHIPTVNFVWCCCCCCCWLDIDMILIHILVDYCVLSSFASDSGHLTWYDRDRLIQPHQFHWLQRFSQINYTYMAVAVNKTTELPIVTNSAIFINHHHGSSIGDFGDNNLT